eukprot:403347363
MIINRNDPNHYSYQDSPFDGNNNNMRPETSGFQNHNWNQNNQQNRQTGMPPPTAGGAQLWNQGHTQERYVDAELRKTKYGDELREQMRENESKKRFQQIDAKVTDHNFLDEFYTYNPFGRGGGGAPLRDQFGTMITSRKPQKRNEYSKNWAYNRGPQYSVMSSNRPLVQRAPTSYFDHYGKPRDLQTRNINLGSYHGGMPQTSIPLQTTAFQQRAAQPAPQQQPVVYAQAPQIQHQPEPVVVQTVNPNFQADYFVQQKAPQADYIRGDGTDPYQLWNLPNYYDWVAWYNEMLSLMYQDRLAREEEDKLRKTLLDQAEAKLQREREGMEAKYRNEYDGKFSNLMGLQEEQLKRMEEYWERRHADELSRWEEMLRLRPYVDRIDNYDALRMTQGLVDHLQNSVRYELNKVTGETAENDQQIQKRINNLKSAIRDKT